MWCSRNRIATRRAVVGALGLTLGALTSGCFRPMLAENTASGGLIGRIGYPDFNDRFGYHLNQSLTDRLGRTEARDFQLAVKTRIKRDDLAITQGNAITRISLTATADWALFRNGETEPLISDQVVSQSGYNSTSSLFATREAKRDIERRLARDLGERIARRVLARADTFTQAG